jgi:hypothetical protein
MTCYDLEHPVAVAKRERRNQQFAIVVAGALIGLGAYGLVRWVKDTASLMNDPYERKSWDL